MTGHVDFHDSSDESRPPDSESGRLPESQRVMHPALQARAREAARRASKGRDDEYDEDYWFEWYAQNPSEIPDDIRSSPAYVEVDRFSSPVPGLGIVYMQRVPEDGLPWASPRLNTRITARAAQLMPPESNSGEIA